MTMRPMKAFILALTLAPIVDAARDSSSSSDSSSSIPAPTSFVMYDLNTFQQVRDVYLKRGQDAREVREYVAAIGKQTGLEPSVLLGSFVARYEELARQHASDREILHEIKQVAFGLQRRQLAGQPNHGGVSFHRSLSGKSNCLAGQKAYCTNEVLGACLSGDCAACPSGQYAEGTTSSLRNCKGCPTGTYTELSGSGQTAQGATDASFCKGCADVDWAGAAALDIKGSATSCSFCPSGQKTYQGARATCVTCQVGRYNDGGCKDCPGGKYTDQAGQSACKGCAAGKYQANDKGTACDKCTQGQYQNEKGITSCILCETGKYEPDEEETTACDECKKGKHQDEEGQSTCKDCTPGFYADVIESVLCKDCAVGWYNPDTEQEGCTRCAAGKHNNMTTQKSENSCLDCIPGKYSNDANYYNKQNNNNSVTEAAISLEAHQECNKCPTGQYQDGTAQTTCKDCGSGYFNDVKQLTSKTNCKGCSPGYYSKEDGKNEANPEDNDGYAVCSACPSGYYQPDGVKDKCLATDPGYSTEKVASVEQDECTPGHFTTKKGCERCYGETVTCLDSVDCLEDCPNESKLTEAPGGDCPVAYFQPQGAQTSCLASVAGKYASETASQAHLDRHPTDELKQKHLAQIAETACPPGKFNHHNGAKRNSVADTGKGGMQGEDHFWGISKDFDECIKCPSGKYQPDEGQTSCIMTISGQYQDEEGAADFKCAQAGWFQPQDEAPVFNSDPRVINSKREESWDNKGTKSERDDAYYVDAEHQVQWRQFQLLPGRSAAEWPCPAGYVSSPCMAYCYPDPVLLTIIFVSVPAGLALLLLIFEEGILRSAMKYKKVFMTPESEMTVIPQTENTADAGQKVIKKMDFKLLLYSLVPFKQQLKSSQTFMQFRTWCGVKTQKEPPDMNVCPPSPDKSAAMQCLQMLKNKHELVSTLFVGKGMKYGVLKRLGMVLFTLTFVAGINSLLYFASGAAHPDCEEELPACDAGPFKDEFFRGIVASVICVPIQAFAKWSFAELAPALYRGERSMVEYYLRFWAFFQISYGLITICIALFMLAVQNDDMDSINGAVVTWPINQALQIPWTLFTYVVITRRFFAVKEDPDYKKQREWKDGKGGEVKPLSLKQAAMSLCACIGAQVVDEDAVEDAQEMTADTFAALPDDLQRVMEHMANMSGPWMKKELAQCMMSFCRGKKTEAKGHFGKYVTKVVIQASGAGQLPKKVEEYGVPLIAAAAAGDRPAGEECAVQIVVAELNSVLAEHGQTIPPPVLELVAWTALQNDKKRKDCLSQLLEAMLREHLKMPNELNRVVIASFVGGSDGFEAEVTAVITQKITEAYGAEKIAPLMPTLIAATRRDLPGAKQALIKLLGSQKEMVESELVKMGAPPPIVKLGVAVLDGDAEKCREAVRMSVIQDIKNALSDQGVPEVGLSLITSLLENDMAAAEEQLVEVVVKFVLMGKLKIPEELEGILTAALMRNESETKSAAAKLVEEQVREQVEAEVEGAGLPKSIADIIMATITVNKEQAKTAMKLLIIDQLRTNGAPEEVCTTITILIEDASDLRKRLEATMEKAKSKQGKVTAKVTPQ